MRRSCFSCSGWRPGMFVVGVLLTCSVGGVGGFVRPTHRPLGIRWDGARRVCDKARGTARSLAMSEIGEAWTMLSHSVLMSDDSFKYFMSGGMAGSISHGWTVPIDVVKTRLQTDDRFKTAGMLHATATILRQEGMQAFSVGMGSTIIGYGVKGSLKYGVYEYLKPIFLASTAVHSEIAAFLWAAAAAELVASIALCPLESTRIRLVTDPSYGKEVFDALPKLIRETGLGVFSGLPAIWCRQLPYTMTQLAVFDALSGRGAALLRDAALGADPAARLAVTLASAAAAGVLSSLASQPGDTILSEVSKAGSELEHGPGGVAAVVRGMTAAGGLQRFFRGTRARLVHMLAVVVSQLVAYDCIKQLLGLAAGH